MLKTLGAQIKEFIPASIATPLFMLFEVLMETIIPLMMASIVDDGVNVGDTHHIMVMGFVITAGRNSRCPLRSKSRNGLWT